jgi:PleD family two-component response regulator
MIASPREMDRFRFLVVEPDEDLAREMMIVLERLDVLADHVRGHLKAVALSEDTEYDCLLVASRGIDITGLELCALVRAREARRSLPPSYTILVGPEEDLVSVFTSAHDVDDYMLGPWMDLELEWKIKRALRAMSLCREFGASRLLDTETGLLTPEGLRTFLYEEVNRIGRREGWLSMSILSVPGLGGLRVSYGSAWLEWFKSGIWSSIRRQLRNYDRLASMDNGFLCLISPDLNEEGTRFLLARLAAVISEYQFQENTEPSTHVALAARYLCARVLGDYRQFGRTGDVLWSWLREKMAEPMSDGIMGYTGTVDLNLQVAPTLFPRIECQSKA